MPAMLWHDDAILLVGKNYLALVAVLLFSLMCVVPPLAAMSLPQAYEAALRNDPVYQSALREAEAIRESGNIGMSGLLPNVTFSYGLSKNNGEISQASQPGSQVDYVSKSLTLSARQPLFNMEAYTRYQQSLGQISYGETTLLKSAHDLIARLTAAYLDALLADDQLYLAAAQRDALGETRVRNERLFEKGEGTRTDMLETQARYELAQAQVVESERNVRHKRNALKIIIGSEPGVLEKLRSDIFYLAPELTSLDAMEKLARQTNPDILAQRHKLTYAEREIDRYRAGHLPRVDLVISQSRSDSESVYYLNRQTNLSSIGVQINVPLYSGGAVNAQTRQAASRLIAAQSDLEASIRNNWLELNRQFNLVESSQLQIMAMQQAEQSALEVVAATNKSVAGGLRINLDVLNAVQQLFTVRRDLAQARYTYLLSYLKLHAAIGILGKDEIINISSHFQAAP